MYTLGVDLERHEVSEPKMGNVAFLDLVVHFLKDLIEPGLRRLDSRLAVQLEEPLPPMNSVGIDRSAKVEQQRIDISSLLPSRDLRNPTPTPVHQNHTQPECNPEKLTDPDQDGNIDTQERRK